MEKKQETEAVNKKILVDRVAEAYPTVTKKDIQGILDTAFDVIAEALRNKEEVKIMGFGRFFVQRKEEREGRKPATGEKILIPAKDYAKFKAAKDLLGE